MGRGRLTKRTVSLLNVILLGFFLITPFSVKNNQRGTASISDSLKSDFPRELVQYNHKEEQASISTDGALVWEHIFGHFSDRFNSIIPTSDGGFAIIGSSESFGYGNSDFWLVKVNDSGFAQWNQTYGTRSGELANSGIQTSDNGYLLGGTKFAGDVDDAWLVKTNAQGETQWTRQFGSSRFDSARSVFQTGDGGYAFAGTTGSYGAGSDDYWLIKTDSNGNEEWTKTFGSANWEYLLSATQTSDGGYAMTGWIEYDEQEDIGDFWLVRTNANGLELWNHDYGGENDDRANAVIQTSDGGFALCGYTQSYGAESADFRVVKTFSNGERTWTGTYGGSEWDEAYSIIQTSDGGFLLAGSTESYGAGDEDAWLVKTDAQGEVIWSQTYGSTGWDRALSVIETSDRTYLFVGQTYRDFNTYAWLVKVGSSLAEPNPPDTTSTPNTITTTSSSVEEDRIPPEIKTPLGITFEIGGRVYQNLSWAVGDRHPGSYELFTNSILIESGSWRNGTITWGGAGLIPGTYNITLVIWDRAENRAENTIWVRLDPPSAPTFTPTIVSSSSKPPSFFIAGFSIFPILVALTTIIIWRKSKK